MKKDKFSYKAERKSFDIGQKLKSKILTSGETCYFSNRSQVEVRGRVMNIAHKRGS